jgi:molybdate transport system ATP-binding protein
LTIDVALSLGREIGVVFGRSGAGKTTLLRLIAGLEAPDDGHVRLDGVPLFDSSARVDRPLRTRRIGMIFQDDLLFPHLTVAGNLRYGLKGKPRAEVETRMTEVAELCGVVPLLDRKPATLSGGERQRVGLARALAPRPRLLLCDEPVSALDLASRHLLIERLRAVGRAESIPILYVTHSPAEAIALGTRLFLLDRGEIVARGDPLDVLATSRAGSIARLEGVRNILPACVDGHAHNGGETHLRLLDGPELIVPFHDRPPGTVLAIEVRGDDILLARGPCEGLSARNIIAGTVDRVVARGPDAEVVVRTGGVAWIVSVVAPAVESLGLAPGSDVRLIVKARSCRVLDDSTWPSPE